MSREALDEQLVPTVLELLFNTHALYHDRDSRIAVHKCLASIIDAGASSASLTPLVNAMRRETQKPGIAASSAFVLAEWCSILMQHLAGSARWDELGTNILLADADALDKCLSAKSGVARSALVVTRRGFRKLLSPAQSREGTLSDVVKALVAKGNQPAAKNALVLGVVAGVCARQAALKPLLEAQKPSYYDFYIREIVGSRVAVSGHVAGGLDDFFLNFATLDEVDKELIPAIEKGLLRAPEVILGGVLTPLIKSLPDTFDLSKTLQGKLLKPLLSNVKSSNPAIRSATIIAFRAIVDKSSDLKALDGVVAEIAAPLGSGKLASPDHRVIHAEMLLAIPLSEQSAVKAASALTAAATKEGNEAALAIETQALARAIGLILEAGLEMPKAVLEVVTKGLAEKKAASRRLWILRVATILQSLEGREPSKGASAFVEATAPKLLVNLEEVIANAAAAAQSGIVVGAYILTALSPMLLKQFPESSVHGALTKANIQKQALSLAAKQAFLLNHRIYTKITAEEDLSWLCRALFSVAQRLDSKTDREVSLAWAEALIYLTASTNIPPKVQQESAKTVSRLYAQRPVLIFSFIIEGLWSGFEINEAKDQDVKAERTSLIYVLRSICLEPGELESFGGEIAQETLEAQACAILVLSRKELIPRSSWIEMCLRMGMDPGDIARKHLDQLLEEIALRTSFQQQVQTPSP